MRYRSLIALLAAALAWAAMTGAAFGFATEGDPARVAPSCVDCHPAWTVSSPADTGGFNGPHGGYTATTKRCATCHDVHAATGVMLLPKATISASCSFCHDGTGGETVYGSIAFRGLGQPGAQHRIDTTRAIPGGDAATGGSATGTFGGLNNTLGCDDCHSPHASNLVTAFAGIRQRTTNAGVGLVSSRLLKKRPTGAAYDVTYYGADWCAGCHKGRGSWGPVHNHPVESSATAGFFHAGRLARVQAPASLLTTISSMINNSAMVMPAPRTADQTGHAPLCQQCHWNTAHVGEPGNADFGIMNIGDSRYLDGGAVGASTNNPRFQNFPHETQNRRMLVELDDDLCTNCHPPALLP